MTPRVELPDLPGWSALSRGDLHVKIHVFGGLPRPDGLQDFVQVTGSVGGSGLTSDREVVERVIASLRVSR